MILIFPLLPNLLGMLLEKKKKRKVWLKKVWLSKDALPETISEPFLHGILKRFPEQAKVLTGQHGGTVGSTTTSRVPGS